MATAAQGAPAPGVRNLDVTQSFNRATITFETSVSSKVVLQLGTDQTYGLVVPDGAKTAHRLDIPGLRPATRYYYLLLAGNRVLHAGQFDTDQAQPATVAVVGRRITLNGVPFFPTIAAISAFPTAETVNQNVSAGVNVLFGHNGDVLGGATVLHRLLQGKAWWLEGDGEAQTRLSTTLPELLGLRWDEDITMHFNPLLVGCRAHSANGLFESISRARGVGKPVIDQLFLQNTLGPAGRSCLTPKRLNVLFWTDVAAGVAGLQYVTDFPWAPGKGFQVEPDVQQRAMQLALQLAAIQPALSGSRLKVRLAPTSVIRVGAYRYRGVSYIIAVNQGDKAARVRFGVAGIGNRTSAVWRESRRLKAKAGVITDRFAAFGVHVYIFGDRR